ncbi:hypothetical protein [Herbiconiux liukaitaii]|uniref:hypothetical protein n=1 Tax=Herbiconiux liukaitaii TaxID=3342799 RepID=UPI0035B9F3B7
MLNERDYILDGPAADRAACDILAAVRHGGDFVQLASVTDTRTKVLITSSTSVRFETIPPAPVGDDGVDGELPWEFYDLDFTD